MGSAFVLSVDDESVAGKAGVKPGDIISRVGDGQGQDTADVHRALGEYDKGDKFDITVLRHGKSQSLKATMDEQDHEFAFRMPALESFHWHGWEDRPVHRARRACWCSRVTAIIFAGNWTI